MSPESLENYNQYENNYSVEQGKYLDIERGDIDPMVLAQNQAQNQFSTTNQQQTKNQSQPDPLEFVRSMISTGFTPTPAQIASANNDLSGPDDSTNTWFAIFLQKLLRQAKIRKARK